MLLFYCGFRVLELQRWTKWSSTLLRKGYIKDNLKTKWEFSLYTVKENKESITYEIIHFHFCPSSWILLEFKMFLMFVCLFLFFCRERDGRRSCCARCRKTLYMDDYEEIRRALLEQSIHFKILFLIMSSQFAVRCSPKGNGSQEFFLLLTL